MMLLFFGFLTQKAFALAPTIVSFTATPAGNGELTVSASFSLEGETTGKATLYLGPSVQPNQNTPHSNILDTSNLPTYFTISSIPGSDLITFEQTFTGLIPNTTYYPTMVIQSGTGPSNNTNTTQRNIAGVLIGNGATTTTTSSSSNSSDTTCNVISITGSHENNQGGTPQNSAFYSSGARPSLTLEIEGDDGCIGKSVTFNLKEIDYGLNGNNIKSGVDDALENRKLTFTNTQKVILNLKVGDEECDESSSAIDCEYGVEITDDAGTHVSWERNGVIPPPNLKWYLSYEACTSTTINGDSCPDDWELVSIQPNQRKDGTLVSDDVLTGTPDPACINDDGTVIDNCYGLLAPLPGLTRITDQTSLGAYLNIVVQIIIGLIGLLAVVMIVVGGIKYMSTDAITGKEEGRQTIQNAVLGLLLALGSFIILNSIDPDLTRLDPDIPEMSIELLDRTPGANMGGDLDFSALAGGALGNVLPPAQGVYCPNPATPNKSLVPGIVNSLNTRVSYRMGGKHLEGQPPYPADSTHSNSCAPGPMCLDCSGFTTYVLYCAGIESDYIIQGTANIFANSERLEEIVGPQDAGGVGEWAVRVQGSQNLIPLDPGDLLGWTADNIESWGHVVIYIGNGRAAESTSAGGGRDGNSIRIKDVTAYGVRGADEGGRLTSFVAN